VYIRWDTVAGGRKGTKVADPWANRWDYFQLDVGNAEAAAMHQKKTLL